MAKGTRFAGAGNPFRCPCRPNRFAKLVELPQVEVSDSQMAPSGSFYVAVKMTRLCALCGAEVLSATHHFSVPIDVHRCFKQTYAANVEIVECSGTYRKAIEDISGRKRSRWKHPRSYCGVSGKLRVQCRRCSESWEQQFASEMDSFEFVLQNKE